MRHRKQTFKINRTSSHRRAMLANMACSLIMEGQIKTTIVRAKELRRIVEKMITLGKRGSLHARRQAIAFLRQPAVARRLFNEVAPTYADRNGGYTRILKLGSRVGDAAEMCLIQLVSEPVVAREKKAPEAAAVEAAVEPQPDVVGEPAEEATTEAEEATDETVESAPVEEADDVEAEKQKAE